MWYSLADATISLYVQEGVAGLLMVLMGPYLNLVALVAVAPAVYGGKGTTDKLAQIFYFKKEVYTGRRFSNFKIHPFI